MEQIKFYMEESILSVKPNATVAEAAKQMAENQVAALLIKDANKCLGIVTDLDFTYKVIAKDLDPKTTKITDVMSHPLITLDCEQSMVEAFKTMRKNNIRHLIVTDNEKLAGILSIKDFANYYNYKFGNEPSEEFSDTEPVNQ
jgi:CBS domain-containing protein